MFPRLFSSGAPAALLLLAFLHPAAGAGPSGSPAGRAPVLLELFTSEGCSSCPPADRLLQKLDHDQPVAGADLIVLSEHVDYWNRLGWTDPYSSAAYSQRQQDYSAHLGNEEVYTPQLLIDGARQVVGSNWTDAERAIKASLTTMKVPVSVSADNVDHALTVRLTVGALNSSSKHGDVYLALAADHDAAQVLRGENAGRALSHVAVVYSIRRIASVSGNSDLNRELTIKEKAAPHAGPIRVIAFVQDMNTKKVLGAAEAKVQD